MLAAAQGILNPIRVAAAPVAGSDGRFMPVRSFQYIQDRRIYAGVKLPNPSRLNQVEERFYHTLTNTAWLWEQRPELRELLPAFAGLLIGEQGHPVGVLTEDFSQGGICPVQERSSDNCLTDCLTDIFTYADRMVFEVNGSLRIGDLDHSFVCREHRKTWNPLLKKITEERYAVTYQQPQLEELFADMTERRYAERILQECGVAPKTWNEWLEFFRDAEAPHAQTFLDTLERTLRIRVTGSAEDMGSLRFSLP